MRLAARVAVCVGLVLVAGQLALGAERQLAGIRLDQLAVNILTIPVYGTPAYIGPVGTTTVTPLQPEPGTTTTVEQAAAAGTTAPTAAMGGPMGRMGGAMGRMAGPMGRMGAAGAVATPAAPAQAGPEPLVYWLYRRPKATRVVIGIRPDATVANITLQGRLPGPEHTSRGIKLGDSYLKVISAYGYPDQTASVGGGLLLTYTDRDLRFVLQGMRVGEISIGEQPIAAGGAQMAGGVGAMAGRAGMIGAMGRMGGPMGRMGAMGRMGGPMGRMGAATGTTGR